MLRNFNNYEYIFSPIRIGNREAKNRIQFAPMVSSLSSRSGAVTNELLGYVKMQAKSGVGVITIGSTPIDHETAVDFVGALDVTSDECNVDLMRISEVAHRYGALMSVELVHAGRAADPSLLATGEAIAPSVIPVEGGNTHIREMDYADMERIKQEYCDVAARLAYCNFDMIMVHAAHGNLIAQFLSPKFNKRTDCYGGSFENRCRYPLEVLRAIRERVGDNLLIDMRISGDELIPGGMKIDETIAFIKMAQDYIDTVHVSQGLIVEPRYMPYTMPAFYLPHCHNVKYSEAVKQDPDIKIPVTVVGSITSMDEAEEIISSGKADMVAMARQLMAEPNTLKDAYYGHSEKSRPCLRCHECASAKIRHIRCATNPLLGREYDLPEIPLARVRKKVIVIGGGVAGCMAAKTLVERGHEVVLFEKEEKLGGKLHEISCLSFKFDMRRHLEWLMRSTMDCGADIRLKTEVTAESIMAMAPDAVFVACGSDRLTLPVPGIDRENVCHVLDVDTGKAETGNTVVVCGGGLSGMESALELAMQGKCVTVVDMISVAEFARDHSPAPRGMLLERLEEYGVKLVGDSRVTGFTDTGVEIEDKNWRHRVLPADSIVTAFGMKKNDRLVCELRSLLPDVYVVGDCNEVKNIMNANQSAFNMALEC